MADSESGDATDFGPLGYTVFSLPEGQTIGKLYSTLTPEQRTWRCEQTKKSSDLVEKSWELLKPISEGRWDKEKAYNGLALFLKAIYEGQGYAALTPDVASELATVMGVVQEHMPYVESGGRRVQADDSPARFALRVAFTCTTMITAAGLAGGVAVERPGWREDADEMQAKALQMALGCMDKLGGPLTHEGTLTAEEKGYIARLATASGPDVQRLVTSTPTNVLALYMLQVQYDIDLRIVKWVLHYVAARCAKEIYGRERSAAAAAAARATWLSSSQALGKLEPGSPLAAFMVAEAKSAEGATPDGLTGMRAAAASAERRGDDVVACLARLNAAHLMVHGACGTTFSEDDVLQEMDAATTHRASVRRWGGVGLVESRYKTLKESLQKNLQVAREQKQKQLAKAGSPSGCQETKDDGRLPSVIHRWGSMTPVAVPLRECAGCRKLFHKAMACGKCRQVWYCGRDCQLAHWKAGHRAECAALASAAATQAATTEDDDREVYQGGQ